MTDLHSHILPGIDDGAADCQAALRLLEMESIQGARRVALTSHFKRADSDIDTFLLRRAESAAQLRAAMAETDLELELKLGCEVMYYPGMISEPIYRLCMEGTDVLLVELPMDHQPAYVPDALEYLRSDGIIPVIAHVERYRYLREDPRILAEWVEMGAYGQINGTSLLRGGERGEMAVKFLKWNLAHLVATDTHNPDKRPPILRQALREVDKQLGGKKAAWLRANADALFAGQEPEYRKPHMPRRFLGTWL